MPSSPQHAAAPASAAHGAPTPGSGPAACPWCARSTDDVVPTGARRVRCRGCGVQLTWPWPDAAELDHAYADWYRPEGGRFSGPGDAILRVTRGSTAWTVDRIAPDGVVIDVGAGDGHLLDALHRRGREAIGLERDTDTTARPDLRDDALDELERPDGGAAAVVLWHVIEHLPEPRAAVREAARLLRPGGVLVLACPNADSRQARSFGDRWLAWDQPRHLVHFTPRALEEGLRAEGFEIRRRGHLRAGQSVFCALHGLVGRVPYAGDLYDAIRQPDARQAPLSGVRRAYTALVAGVLLPVAAAAAVGEAREGRGASIYLEAVRTAVTPTSDRHAR
ncbi:class I SAM-dependent methyltransferase [Patulibacter sp.]|uniref:class I SAM-dependent methyltransferase n=1 Tax=Patulibacter sp. TaxID=1912859 RepID=UPI0027266FF0|nr:class I SAM-dependent methyltransferase [Patulibacter sp.]MDO9409883.1 class I SAM-dependent methyltransferase [Patulibacter sp.]